MKAFRRLLKKDDEERADTNTTSLSSTSPAQSPSRVNDELAGAKQKKKKTHKKKHKKKKHKSSKKSTSSSKNQAPPDQVIINDSMHTQDDDNNGDVMVDSKHARKPSTLERMKQAWQRRKSERQLKKKKDKEEDEEVQEERQEAALNLGGEVEPPRLESVSLESLDDAAQFLHVSPSLLERRRKDSVEVAQLYDFYGIGSGAEEEEEAGGGGGAAAAAAAAPDGGAAPTPPPKGMPLEAILADPEELGNFLKFVPEATQQEVLFVCELDQFLKHGLDLEPAAINLQLQKIYHIYLSPDGTAHVESLPADVRANLEECIRTGRFSTETFLAAKHAVEDAISSSALRAYWDFLNGTSAVKGRFLPQADDEDGGKSGFGYAYEFEDVVTDPFCFRAFLLFLVQDRRHRMLLFWRDLRRAQVHQLEAAKLDEVVQGDAQRACRLYQQLQTVFRAYVSTVNRDGDDVDADRGVVTFGKLQTLLLRLKPMHQKMEKILRLQLWPNFCRSDHYQDLLQQAKQHEQIIQRAATVKSLSSLIDEETLAVGGGAVLTPVSLPNSPPESPALTPRGDRRRGPLLVSALRKDPGLDEMVVLHCREGDEEATVDDPALLSSVVVFRGVVDAGVMSRRRGSTTDLYSSMNAVLCLPADDSVPPHLDQFCFPFNRSSARNNEPDAMWDAVSELCQHRVFPFVLSSREKERLYAVCLQVFVREPAAGGAQEEVEAEEEQPNGQRPRSRSWLHGHAVASGGGEGEERVCYSVCVLSTRDAVSMAQGAFHGLFVDVAEELRGVLQPGRAVEVLRAHSTMQLFERLTQPLSEHVLTQLNRLFFNPAPSAQRLSAPVQQRPTRHPGAGPGARAFDILFSALHPTRVLAFFESLLLEKRILLVSSQLSTLTAVAECGQALMYPLSWAYLYIPLLPQALFQYLQCPTPFLIGIHSSGMEQALATDGVRSADLVVVDLDKDEVHMPKGFESALPEVWRRKLVQTMRGLYRAGFAFADAPGGARTGLSGEVEPQVALRQLFLKMWVDLLQHFRHYCMFFPDERDPALVFDTPSFLNDKPRSYHRLLEGLAKTQSFSTFLSVRSHREYGLRDLGASQGRLPLVYVEERDEGGLADVLCKELVVQGVSRVVCEHALERLDWSACCLFDVFELASAGMNCNPRAARHPGENSTVGLDAGFWGHAMEFTVRVVSGFMKENDA